MIDSPYLVTPGSTPNLHEINPADTGPFHDKSDAKKQTHHHLKQLSTLQEVLYAQSRHAVLVVFQAMDAGGKDGAIRSIFSGVNPQGCQVSSFKVPTALELAHDFLWRIHAACPPKGMIGIFNRSHYESVLVERVKKIVPDEVWKRRFAHICNFEKMLHDEGTTIIKFYLHISKDEQKQRLQDRLDEKDKNWKFNPADLKERARWDDYMHAFADALARTSTAAAPWYVIPSNKKWYRNFAIAEILTKTMDAMNLKFPAPVEGLESIEIE